MPPTASLALPQPRPLWKTYLAILVPMMLTNILQSAAGTIDGIYLGQMIGVDAIAAVSSFFPVFFFLLAIIIGLSSGATVLIGQAWGAGNHARVRAVAGTALCLMLCAGFTISIVGGIFAPQLMRALGTPPVILGDATIYARLMLLGMPVIFLVSREASCVSVCRLLCRCSRWPPRRSCCSAWSTVMARTRPRLTARLIR